MKNLLIKIGKVTLIYIISLLLTLGIISVFALGFPGGTPSGEISGGYFMKYFNKILVNPDLAITDGTVKKAEKIVGLNNDCGVGKVLQGFTSTGGLICVSNSSFLTISSTGATLDLGLKNTGKTTISNVAQTDSYVCAEVLAYAGQTQSSGNGCNNYPTNYINRTATTEWVRNGNGRDVTYAHSFYSNNNNRNKPYENIRIHFVKGSTKEKVIWDLKVEATCMGLPANAKYYGGGTNYKITNSNTNNPSTIAVYNANPSIQTCQFNCNSGYKWNGSSCVVSSCSWQPIGTSSSPLGYPNSSCSPSNAGSVTWVNANDFKCVCN